VLFPDHERTRGKIDEELAVFNEQAERFVHFRSCGSGERVPIEPQFRMPVDRFLQTAAGRIELVRKRMIETPPIRSRRRSPCA
jgi:hypothetical protein